MFIIEEGISLDEVKNTDGIKYMYDNSSIYRNLITPQNILYIVPEADFNILSDDVQSILYERHSFYLDKAKKLDLSMSYKLEEGKMTVWLVSPDGKIIYQTETKNSFEQTIKQPLDKGIYSIVLVYEMDNGNLKGHKSIQGNFTSQNISNKSSNTEIVDIKAENPPSLLHISDSNDGLVEVKLNLQSKIKDTSNLKLSMEKDDDNFYPIFTKKGTITFDKLNSGKGNFKTDKTIKLDYPIKEDDTVDFNGLIDVTYMIDNPIDKNSSNLIPLTIETPVKVISKIDGTHYWEAKDIVLYTTTDKGKQKIIITISDEAQKPEIKTINENN